MFEGNPYKLPEEKFDHFRQVFQDLGVTITVMEVSKNPHLDLSACQDSDDIRTKGIGRKSRKLTSNSYSHVMVVLKKGDLVREIFMSIQNEVYHDDGKLIVNPDLRFIGDLSAKSVGLYLVTSCLFWLMLCQNPREAFQYLIDDDLYLWAETYGIADRLDEGRFERSFEYYKGIAQSLIDVLGKGIVINLRDSFFTCGSCGHETEPKE